MGFAQLQLQARAISCLLGFHKRKLRLQLSDVLPQALDFSSGRRRAVLASRKKTLQLRRMLRLLVKLLGKDKEVVKATIGDPDSDSGGVLRYAYGRALLYLSGDTVSAMVVEL